MMMWRWKVGSGRLRRSATALGVCCCGVFSAVAAPDAGASDASVREHVAQANEALSRGDYAGAVQAYSKAQEGDPESPEIAYNLGVAAYRQGDMAKAKEQFLRALRTGDANLEAKAKFNLGDVAYAQALAKKSAIPEAIQSLRTAVANYRDALDVRTNDPDARANIEMAWLLIKKLEAQQKQQEQDKDKKQSEQNGDEKQEQKSDKPQSQPASQPLSRPAADQDQQEDSEQNRPDQRNKKQKDAGQSPPQGTDQQDAAPQPAQAKPLSQEEAERLLQSVRDRERERRLVLQARIKQKAVKTKKDW